MKAKVNREVVFKPVEVTIMLETADELNVFKTMCQHDFTVPSAIYSVDSASRKLLGSMLGNLNQLLHKGNEDETN